MGPALNHGTFAVHSAQRDCCPCGMPLESNKRLRFSTCAESCTTSVRSDASSNSIRRKCRQGNIDAHSPWQELPSGVLLTIMRALHNENDGEASVRRCGCVCRAWKDVSAELLMTDTAASKPPRRPLSRTPDDGFGTSLATLRGADSLSKSITGGGSEHQSPLIPIRNTHNQAQTPQPHRQRTVWHEWQRLVPTNASDNHGQQQSSRVTPDVANTGSQCGHYRLYQQQGTRCADSEQVQASGRRIIAAILQPEVSYGAPPSPQRAIVEDTNLLSESDAQGGCVPSLRTGELSDSSAPSRSLHQPAC